MRIDLKESTFDLIVKVLQEAGFKKQGMDVACRYSQGMHDVERVLRRKYAKSGSYAAFMAPKGSLYHIVVDKEQGGIIALIPFHGQHLSRYDGDEVRDGRQPSIPDTWSDLRAMMPRSIVHYIDSDKDPMKEVCDIMVYFATQRLVWVKEDVLSVQKDTASSLGAMLRIKKQVGGEVGDV